MSIVLMTGDHPRHAYIASQIAASGLLSGLVIEEREEHLPAAPEGLPTRIEALFVQHFDKRARVEQRFFPPAEHSLPKLPTLRVTREELNGEKTWTFLEKLSPALLLSYGVHKLSPETLAKTTGQRWNIHGGLSPWYRGCITHFWPSYLLEPQMTGMTVHTLTDKIDGGEIVHQSAAPLVRGDGLHDLACRAVMSLGEELPALLHLFRDGGIAPPKRQRSTGRIWRAADWRPAHLALIYDSYNDQIVDRYLDGDFGIKPPKLQRQKLS